MSTLSSAIILVVGGGGIIGAVIAVYKVKPERESIIVTAAQGAVIIQAGVIEELQEQLTNLREQLEREVGELRQRLQEVTRERDSLAVENSRLVRRVDLLERDLSTTQDELQRLKGEVENGS